MTIANAKSSTSPPNRILARLVASKAISQFQADWLKSIWPSIDRDSFAHPHLRTVPEHTRAYLETVART